MYIHAALVQWSENIDMVHFGISKTAQKMSFENELQQWLERKLEYLPLAIIDE